VTTTALLATKRRAFFLPFMETCTVSEIPVHIIAGEPRILDLDLAFVLGMRRPLNIRTGTMKLLSNVLANCGLVHRDGDAYYLNEDQARAICHFSTGRKAAMVDRLVVVTFRKYYRETQPQMAVVEALRLGLAPFDGSALEGREALIVDAIRSKLRQTARPRKYLTTRRRPPRG
jgi:hypothetical protein